MGSIEEAIADIQDGAGIMFGGFAGVGVCPPGWWLASKIRGLKTSP